MRGRHSRWLLSIAIALALSFVVHDVERTHDHPFAPFAHSHEHNQGHSKDQSDASVSVYTHGDRKDFLALLLLIAAIPVAQLFGAYAPRFASSQRPRMFRRREYDYHLLLFSKGILHSKRY